MNCSLHNNVPAVNTCSACGDGMCGSCMKQTQSYGKLCVPCAIDALHEDIAETKATRIKLIIKTVIMAIGWVIGVIIICFGIYAMKSDMQTSGDPSAGIVFIAVGALFAGLTVGIASWKNAKQAQREYEAEHGASYTVTDYGVYKDNHTFVKIFYFILGLVLGVIWNPIQIIINSVKADKMKKLIPQYESLLTQLNNYMAKTSK